MNLHYGFLRVRKLIREGTGSNLGPRNYAIRKTIHQNHIMHGDSEGMWCVSNNYIAIMFSIIKNINILKSFDLDYILE